MNTEELPVIRLEGAPRTRGRMHGELLRARIVDLLNRWEHNLDQCYGVDPRHYVTTFFEHTDYRRALAHHAPRVLEEVQGIAEGAGVDEATLLAFQHVNEEFEMAPMLARHASAEGEACSTIVASPRPDRPALIAQNLDLAQFLDGFQVLLRGPCDESEGEVLVLSVPGMVSLNGMNSYGLAVCDNTLTQLRTNRAGVPIFAIYRLLLECRTVVDALELIERTPHAVGLNWVLGDPEDVAMIERSAHVTAHYGPRERQAVAFHTNHPLVCSDWAEAYAPDARNRPRPARSSYLRLAAMHQRLAALREEAVTIDALKTILASRDDPDYPVSRAGGANLDDQPIGFTLACNIFELRRGGPRWHIASGPPHRTTFRTFGFD